MKVKNRKISTEENGLKKNGFHKKNDDDSHHIMNGKTLMNGDCHSIDENKKFRDQVSVKIYRSINQYIASLKQICTRRVFPFLEFISENIR